MIDLYTFLDSIFQQTFESKPKEKEKEGEIIDVAFEEIKEESNEP